jgi:HEAT repeat protein
MRCTPFTFAVALLAVAAAFAQTTDQKATIQQIRELGKRDNSVLPALTAYLANGDTTIRLEAVKAIVKIGSMRSLDPLVKATHDSDSEIQIRAIDGIVNAYEPGYVAGGSLTGVLTKGIRQVKSIFSARNDQIVDPDVKVRPDVAEALADRISNGSGVDVKSDAALAAGILRANTAVPALEQALHAKDSDLIFECLIALQKIKDPSAGASVQFLARDLDDRVQSTALETLGVLRSVSAAPDIRGAFKNARNVRIQRAALEALAMLGLPEDRPLFQQYAATPDAEVRVAALEGLGRIREPEDTPKLEAAFNEANSDWRDHMAAAFALVSEGSVSTEVLSPLSYLVEGLGLKARASVATAYLTELARRQDVRDALAKIMPEATKDQKIAVLIVLGSAGSPDAVKTLESYTGDRDKDVAYAASKALRMSKFSRNL